jgi:hypothetical protein
MFSLARTIIRVLDTHYPPSWTEEEDQLRSRGLEVMRGRLGSISVRDPRFDQIEVCPDCRGTGLDPVVTCPHTEPPCDWCRVPCETCDGRGTVHVVPAATNAAGRL